MDLQRKTIQTLTGTLDERREELSKFYRHFGERLLKDSSDPSVSAGALPPDRVSTWKDLLSSRESDTRTILEIKEAVARQQELLNFRKELEDSRDGETTLQREQYEKFGQSLFSRYDPDRDELNFGPAHDEAERESTILAGFEEKKDFLKNELEEAGFFGKMFAQFRMAGLASNIRLHRSRMLKSLADGAKRLVESEGFEAKMSSGSYDQELSGIYSTICETRVRMKELERRESTLEDDLATVADTLTACATAGNPGRRMEELRARTRETDKRIDALTSLCAREYCDKFLDEDGRSVLGDATDGNSFSDMGAYAHQLEQVSLHRSQISVIRRRIEVLETTLRIESIDKNISGYERSIADYEHKIEHYRKLTENLRKNVLDAQAEREKLVERKAEIGKTLEKDPAGEGEPV